MRNLLIVTSMAVALLMPLQARADDVGAVFGATTGFFVAGPVGMIIGAIVGGVWGKPFWGPPHDPRACFIDSSFHRHCKRVARR